jgi:hypothetical protein
MQQNRNRPLLTGNGVSAGFSVLVGWHTSIGAGLAPQKYRGRKHAETDFGGGIDRGFDLGKS